MCCLAPVGQPKAQTPRALAAARVAVQEAAGPAERLGAALGDERVAAGDVLRDAGDADLLLDLRVVAVARGRGRARAPSGRGPCSGARKQVPELTSVVPPTVRPSGSTIGGLPSVAVWPASRYRRGIMSRGRRGHARSCGCAPPSSRTATRRAGLGERAGDGRAAGAGPDHADVSALVAHSRRRRRDLRVAVVAEGGGGAQRLERDRRAAPRRAAAPSAERADAVEPRARRAIQRSKAATASVSCDGRQRRRGAQTVVDEPRERAALTARSRIASSWRPASASIAARRRPRRRARSPPRPRA